MDHEIIRKMVSVVMHYAQVSFIDEGSAILSLNAVISRNMELELKNRRCHCYRVNPLTVIISRRRVDPDQKLDSIIVMHVSLWDEDILNNIIDGLSPEKIVKIWE